MAFSFRSCILVGFLVTPLLVLAYSFLLCYKNENHTSPTNIIIAAHKRRKNLRMKLASSSPTFILTKEMISEAIQMPITDEILFLCNRIEKEATV